MPFQEICHTLYDTLHFARFASFLTTFFFTSSDVIFLTEVVLVRQSFCSKV